MSIRVGRLSVRCARLPLLTPAAAPRPRRSPIACDCPRSNIRLCAVLILSTNRCSRPVVRRRAAGRSSRHAVGTWAGGPACAGSPCSTSPPPLVGQRLSGWRSVPGSIGGSSSSGIFIFGRGWIMPRPLFARKYSAPGKYSGWVLGMFATPKNNLEGKF